MFAWILFFILFLLSIALTSYIARRKGYSEYLWFAAGGLVGWIFLAILPNLNSVDMPPEQRKKKALAGNLPGFVLSVIAMLLFAYNVNFFAGVIVGLPLTAMVGAGLAEELFSGKNKFLRISADIFFASILVVVFLLVSASRVD